MGSLTRTRPTSFVQRFTFGLDPLVDGQTDAALTPADSAIGALLMWGGSIVGLSVVADEAAGAGVTTFDVKVDSTQFSIDLSLGASATEVYSAYPVGLYKVAAGQLLGASYTSGTLTTNAGVRVDVYVQFDEYRS